MKNKILHFLIFSLFLLGTEKGWGQYASDVPSTGLTSPVIGNYQYQPFGSTCGGISTTIWGFCHSSHHGSGIGGCDDSYALDCNLTGNADNGKDVYPVEEGWISHYNSNWAGGSYGQLLIRHVTNGKTWYSGYLHMSNITSKKATPGAFVSKNEIIGKVSNVSPSNITAHLHFALYYSNGSNLISVNRSSFNVRSECPQVPNTHTPSNGTTVGIPVLFDWEDAVGGDDTNYRIQVSTSNTGWTAQNGFTSSSSENNTIRVNQVTGDVSSFIWTSSSAYPPQPNTTYYYTVKTFACGQSSNYSAVKSFTTSCNVIIPTPIFPTNGQTNVGIPVSFDWNDVGNNPQYRIQVSTTNSGWTAVNGFTSSTSESSTVRVNQNTNDISSYNWTSSSAYPPQNGVTYYWTVKAFACGNNSNYSPVRSFTVGGQTNNYTITTSSNPSAGGTTSGGGTYSSGSNRTVTATVNSGYTFTNWTENGNVVSSNSSYNFVLNSNRNLVANFTQQGGGSCVNCPNHNFSPSINSNWNTHSSSIDSHGCKIYRFLAVPGRTYTFKTGCGNGATANFDTQLELIDSGCSVIASDDDECESNRSSIEWTCNYSSTNWVYLKVKGYSSENGNFTLAYREITPSNNYTITTSSNPTAGGTTSGSGTYSSGSNRTVTATANSGYTFTNWTENGTIVHTSSSYTFVLNSNRNLVANFIQQQTGTPCTGGDLYPLETQFASSQWKYLDGLFPGEYSHHRVSPGITYEWSLCTSDGGIANFDSQITIITYGNDEVVAYNNDYCGTASKVVWTSDYNGDVKVLITKYNCQSGNEFAKLAYRIVDSNQTYYSVETSSNPYYMGSTFGAGTYTQGQNVSVSASAYSNYTFQNWTENGVVVSTANPFVFNASSNRDFVANFVANNYTINTTSNPTNGGTTTGAGNYTHGSNVVLDAIPNVGFSFINWTESGNIVSTNPSFSFNANSNRNLVANFSQNSYTISTSSNPSNGGITTGGGNYSYGEEVTISAIPNEGYLFSDWSENGIPFTNDASVSIIVNENRNLTANFVVNNLYVMSSSIPETGGETSGGGTYAYGSTVNMNAIANDGFSFLHWTHNNNIVHNQPEYSFVITSNKILKAHFTQNNYAISTSSNPTNGGTTTGGGNYNHGATATFTAAPNDGYTFINWTENGTVVSSNESFEITVTENHSYVANFSQNSYTISTSSNPTNGGTTTGGGNYNHGATATFTAASNEGYTFINWTENGTEVSNDESFEITVTENHNYVANFTQNSYTISTSSNPANSGTTTGAGNYNNGTTATLTASANDGYTFINWTENGTEVSDEESFEITVTENHNYVANFSQNSYTISTSSNPTNGGTTTGGGNYNHGATATFTAASNEGYTFITGQKMEQ